MLPQVFSQFAGYESLFRMGRFNAVLRRYAHTLIVAFFVGKNKPNGVVSADVPAGSSETFQLFLQNGDFMGEVCHGYETGVRLRVVAEIRISAYNLPVPFHYRQFIFQ